jgi:APA family basic amino acid/polyamine antiporter
VGVQNAVVIAKLAVLGVFLLVAASKLGTHAWSWAGPAADGRATGAWSEIQLFASSVMWISLSFAGFNAGIYIASEVRDAERVVPRSLLIGTLLVTVVYLLLNAVFLTAVPVEQIREKRDIAAIAAAGLGGAPLEALIRLAVSLGTLSSVAGMVMTGPRVFSRMADDGLFPAYFCSGPHSTSRTVLLQTGIAVFLVYATDFRALLNYLSAVLALSSALTVSTLFIPEQLVNGEQKLSKSGTISVWTGGAAFLYVVATLMTASLMAVHDPGNLKGAFWTIVSGTCLWVVATRLGRPRRECVP